MARTVREAKLETRASRAKLALGKLHLRTLVPAERHLAYLRKRKDQAGMFKVRRYKGGERYQIAALGFADDLQDAGPGILNFAQAQRAAHAYQWETAAPRSRPRPGGPTVADVIRDYISWMKVHRATAHDTQTRASTWILPKLGHRRVAELDTADYEQWKMWMAEQPAKLRGGKAKHVNDPRARKASANKVLTTLLAALNKAWRDGHVADDSAWRRVKPFGQVNAARPGFLSLTECQRLINAADEASGFRDLVHGALLTGARYGELCRLQVRDFVNGKLHIARSKTGRARNITLSSEGIAFFAALTVGRSVDEVLLPRRTGAFGYWKKDEQSVPMQEACARAHVALTFHGLRHSYASLSVMAGMPLQLVAQNLGHVDTRMVERHYGHLTDSYVDETIRKHAPQFGVVRASNVRALR